MPPDDELQKFSKVSNIQFNHPFLCIFFSIFTSFQQQKIVGHQLQLSATNQHTIH